VKDDSLAWIAEEEAIALQKKSRNFSYSNSENALAGSITMEKDYQVNYKF
jgi:hypothetical protein